LETKQGGQMSLNSGGSVEEKNMGFLLVNDSARSKIKEVQDFFESIHFFYRRCSH
jgi:hypothetical protein